MADAILDFENIESATGRLVLDEKNPMIELAANFRDGHQCLAYDLFRTPNLTRAGFQAVPADAVAVLSLALGEAGDMAAKAQALQKALSLTGLDIGREIFANMEQLTLFALPPERGRVAYEGLLDRRIGPVPFCLGLAITSRNPQQTRQILHRLLSLPAIVISGAAGEPAAPAAGEDVQAYVLGAFGSGMVKGKRVKDLARIWVGQAGRSTILSLNPTVVAAAVQAVRTGNSAVDAGPLAKELGHMPAEASKMYLVNLGGAIQLFLAHKAKSAEALDPESPAGQFAGALAGTNFQLASNESPNRFLLQAGLKRLPPLGGVFPLVMRFQQAMGSGTQFEAPAPASQEPAETEPAP